MGRTQRQLDYELAPLRRLAKERAGDVVDRRTIAKAAGVGEAAIAQLEYRALKKLRRQFAVRS